MPQSLLSGQLKEKPTYRVRCLYSSFVHGVREFVRKIFFSITNNWTKSVLLYLYFFVTCRNSQYFSWCDTPFWRYGRLCSLLYCRILRRCVLRVLPMHWRTSEAVKGRSLQRKERSIEEWPHAHFCDLSVHSFIKGQCQYQSLIILGLRFFQSYLFLKIPLQDIVYIFVYM